MDLQKITSNLLSGKPVRMVIKEAAEDFQQNFVFKVTGYYSTYARTENDAKNNLIDEDFGDLHDMDYEVDSVEDTMDGYRNDQVHVTYQITGLVDVQAANETEAETLVQELDIGPIEDAEFELSFD